MSQEDKSGLYESGSVLPTGPIKENKQKEEADQSIDVEPERGGLEDWPEEGAIKGDCYISM